jgi:hypothetical protein
MFQQRGGQQVSLARKWPGCWVKFMGAMEWRTLRVNDPILFMRRLKAPGGAEYLVVVMLWSNSPARGSMAASFRTEVYSPATVSSPARRCWFAIGDVITNARAGPLLAYSKRARFYAGQPDATNQARFTVSYDIDGVPGTIDGSLSDKAVVKMRVRSGPGAASAPGFSAGVRLN